MGRMTWKDVEDYEAQDQSSWGKRNHVSYERRKQKEKDLRRKEQRRAKREYR